MKMSRNEHDVMTTHLEMALAGLPSDGQSRIRSCLLAAKELTDKADIEDEDDHAIDTLAIRKLCVEGARAIRENYMQLAEEAFARIRKLIRVPDTKIQCNYCLDTKRVHYGGSFGGPTHYQPCHICS